MSTANGFKLQIMKSNSAEKSVEEKFQLLRVFRLLAFEIPLQRVEQKLQVQTAFHARCVANTHIAIVAEAFGGEFISNGKEKTLGYWAFFTVLRAGNLSRHVWRRNSPLSIGALV